MTEGMTPKEYAKALKAQEDFIVRNREDMRLYERYAVPAMESKLQEWGFDASDRGYHHHRGNAGNIVTLKLNHTPNFSARAEVALSHYPVPDIDEDQVREFCSSRKSVKDRENYFRNKDDVAIDYEMNNYLGALGIRAIGEGLIAERKARGATRGKADD